MHGLFGIQSSCSVIRISLCDGTPAQASSNAALSPVLEQNLQAYEMLYKLDPDRVIALPLQQ
jgi:hypothetical protein